MTQDVDMKEQQVPASPSSSLESMSHRVLQHFKKRVVELIEGGAYTGKVRWILRAVSITIVLRWRLKVSVIYPFLNFALTTGSEAHSRLISFFPKDDDHEMEVDTASSATQGTVNHSHEMEIYCYFLVLIFLIDQKKYTEAKACSSAGIASLKNSNRRTVDVLASRLYFYYSLSHELSNSLSEIRGNLLVLHRVARLHHDELGQERLLNLILHNYLHYNLYDQAEKFRSKAPPFEVLSLPVLSRKESLLQAARKAPVERSLGFRVQCNKWAIIVRLLLGEIPERTLFKQKGMKNALRPYFDLTNAVRIGDLELLKTVAEKFSTTFTSDRTNNLIVRLRHNVIRNRLRHISIAYSRISLADVATKLRLNPLIADVESIVSKAIRDGAIDAMLDHANGWMVSKETGDIYSTNEPQIAFNSRIAFCLNMHNLAVRSLRFPPNYHKEQQVDSDSDSDTSDEEYDDEY
uniref:PCI domain-containing protein n=1 Tax=Lactuca sativa TaxID=4236 RepID=A0A9R1WX61_LACSA|nr:hypothetical protein LSAT_V11C800438890 [Lactuca sativa]